MKYVIKEVNDKAQANNISSSNESSHTPINIFAFSLLRRSPLRYHNGNAEPFILPGYALSPDEDEDSGADSLNEHLGNIEGKKLKNP